MSERQVDHLVSAGAEQARDLTVNDLVQQQQLLQEVLNKVLKEDIHYGRIPGTEGMALYQPGADKLAFLFRLGAKFEVSRTDLQGRHREFSVRCVLQHIPTGRFVCEGMGSCSTLEAKYRYRNSGRICPSCGADAIFKTKRPGEEGFFCWSKKGGCGAEFPSDSPEIVSQQGGRTENPDIEDQYNTVLKMACKRAKVAAILAATGAGDILDDDDDDAGRSRGHRSPAQQKARQSSPPQDPERAKLIRECADLYNGVGGDKDQIDAALDRAGVAKNVLLKDRTLVDLQKIKAAFAAIASVILFLLAPLTAQALAPVLVDNLGSEAQTSWVTVGLPDDVVVKPRIGYLTDTQTKARFEYVAGDRCVRVHLVDVAPGRHKLAWTGDAAEVSFALHPGIDLMRMLPRWWYAGSAKVLSDYPAYWPLGAQKPAASFVRVLEQDECHQLWHVRAQHPDVRLTHDLWATIWTNQRQVDWVAISVYGDTRNDRQPQEIGLSTLYLWGFEEPWADFRPHVGLPNAGQNQDGSWALPLTTAQETRLFRGRRILTRGVWAPDRARKGPPLSALWAGWDGHWFWKGTVGRVPVVTDLAAARDLYLHPPRTDYWGAPVNYWMGRPYVQPPLAETTGEQAGFGCTLLGRAVAANEPWFVTAALFSCDSYAYRPTGNREPDGEPFAASRHPAAVSFGQAFEQRIGGADLCGWPKDGEQGDVRTWWTGPSPSEQQHRDARTLHGTFALTRDPALRSVIADCLELEKCDALGLQGRTGAPRALGRLLLDWCGGLWCGFDGYGPIIDRMMGAVAAEVARHPGDLFSLGEIGEGKYGWKEKGGQLAEWNDPQASPILGIQPWQETIASVQGLDEVWLARGDQRARTWSLRAATQAVEFGFYQVGEQWRHVYALAWRNGALPPASAFAGEIANLWQVTDGACEYWTLGACELVAHDLPDTDVGRKARAILADRGPPRDWIQAQWRGVR